MTYFDFTVNLPIILTVIAVAAPILTALINNWHHTRMRKLELKEQRYKENVLLKRTIFENYLRYAGRCICVNKNASLEDYGEYYLLALMYAPPEIQEGMKKVHSLLTSGAWSNATNDFEELVPKIQALLQSL